MELVAVCVVVLSPWLVQAVSHTGNMSLGLLLGIIWIAGIIFSWVLAENKASRFWFISIYTILSVTVAGMVL